MINQHNIIEWMTQAEKEFGIDICEMEIKNNPEPSDRVLYHLLIDDKTKFDCPPDICITVRK